MVLVCFLLLENNLAFALFWYLAISLTFRRSCGWYKLATYNPVNLIYYPVLLTGASALELAMRFLLLSSFTAGIFCTRYGYVFSYIFCYLCSLNLSHCCCFLVTACHFILSKTLKQKGFDNTEFFWFSMRLFLFTFKISARVFFFDILHLFI